MINTTIGRLQELISEKLDINIAAAEIEPDANMLEGEFGMDSIAIVELITLTEEEFGFEFGEDDLSIEAFQSVRTLATTICGQLEPQVNPKVRRV